jgi:hypothetical protein
MSEKRIVAVFVPEAWIKDHAVEVDGRVEFDVTQKILAMSEEERKQLRDNDYNTDDLVPEEIGEDHRGPFRVEVKEAIENYFAGDHDHAAARL